MRRINAKHMEVHVSGPFQNKKIERVIGLFFLAIMDKHGWLNLISSPATCNVCYWKLRQQILILVTVKLIMRFINICQHEFGPDSIWKHVRKNNGRPPQTVKRLSYVYSCDTTEETIGKQGLNEVLRSFCLSFKKAWIQPSWPFDPWPYQESCRGSL